ncbi:BTAD domain-containing putative transcriptional regulator [Streptomyces sp. NPDC088794]|uniref:BTAD domain-containing putative transcriptional regulator n=1 Tax=Streptomyces sp. NPDC088794 TaxID=3365902 RepID=UPI0038221298
MLRIRVLGSPGADLAGNPVPLGAPQQRAVLALLIVARGSTVPVERMADALWRGTPPAKAVVSLHTYVSNLRRSLEPRRLPRTPATVLVTAPPGYALRLPADAVDAWRFEAQVARARHASAEEARALLAEALDWWQGPAFAEHADEDWAAAEVARLTELRAEARELAVAAALRTGHAAEAAPAAEVLVRESPLREEGWRLLALAQWTCGRQADALAAVRRAAGVLREELGCDPGPALAEVERAVLLGRADVLRGLVEAGAGAGAGRLSPVSVRGGWPGGSGSSVDGGGGGGGAGAFGPGHGAGAGVGGGGGGGLGASAYGRGHGSGGGFGSSVLTTGRGSGGGFGGPGSVRGDGTGGGVGSSASVRGDGTGSEVGSSASVRGDGMGSGVDSSASVLGHGTGGGVGSSASLSGDGARSGAPTPVFTPGPLPGSGLGTPVFTPGPLPGSGLGTSVFTPGPLPGGGLGTSAFTPGQASRSELGPLSLTSAHGSASGLATPTPTPPPAHASGSVIGSPESASASASASAFAEAAYVPGGTLVPSEGLAGGSLVPSWPTPALAVDAARDGHDLFVGRERELRALDAAAQAARPRGGVVLVSGEAGAGKSALLGQFAGRLRAGGWRVVVGRCPEDEGAPPAWAWVEALGALARDLPPARPEELAVLLREPEDTAAASRDEATAGRFRTHRAFAAWLRAAAGAGPLAVVLEDLHRADGETLALLEAAADVTGVPLLTVTSHRPAEVGEHLLKTLADLAPRAPHRITLAGLSPTDVATVVDSVCGETVDTSTVTALAERTGGNPFYVLESARLLASEGALVAVSEVPQGVRDVLRRRLALLPAGALSTLQLAAAVGLEADVALLIDARDTGAGGGTGGTRGLDEEAVLDGLDAALAADLLAEPGPGRVRFVHALVRDTVYTDLSGVRRARLHARIAQALSRHRPDDLAALAHHFARSGTAAHAPLAVDYALRAAESAERRYAHDVAVDLIQQAIDVHTATGAPGAGAMQLDRTVGLLVRLLGAQVRAGATDAALHTRRRAVDLAERADRGDLVAAVYGAWTEPSPWRSRLEGFYDRTALARLERLTTDPALDDPTRARVLQVLVEVAAAVDVPRALDAAHTQLSLARAHGEPRLLAAALMTSAKLLPHEAHGTTRTPLVAELRRLAEDHDLPAYRWTCEHLDAMTAGTRNDPAAVRRHTEQGVALAHRYGMLWAQGLNAATTAMLATVAGHFDAAEAAYADADDLGRRVGARHATRLRTLGLITIRLAQGRTAEIEPLMREVYDAVGAPVGVALALGLAHLGRLDEAREVRCPDVIVTDHLYGIDLDFRAQLAVMHGDMEAAAVLIEHLLPLRNQLAGAAGAAYATRPLAHALADLYRLLGEDRAAADHYALAERTARAWSSTHLTANARRAAGELAAAQGRRRTFAT